MSFAHRGLRPRRQPQVPDALDILVWLRARIGVTTSSGEVTAWADQSGNGHDSTEVGTFLGGGPPVLLTNQLDGHPAIFFGEPHGIRCNTGPTYNQANDPQCFIWVLKSESVGGANVDVDFYMPGTVFSSSGPPRVFRNDDDWRIQAAGSFLSSTGGADDDWHLLIANIDDHAQALYVDGVEVLTGTINISSTSRTGWRIGTVGGSSSDSLHVAEFVFLDGVLDSAGRTAWRNYLKQSSEYPSLP